MDDSQIQQMRTYLTDLPKKLRDLLDTKEKKERYNVRLSEIDNGDSHVKWAEQYYNVSPLYPPVTIKEPESEDEKTLAAYYAIEKLYRIMTDDRKRKELFEYEFSLGGNETFFGMGFIEKSSININ